MELRKTPLIHVLDFVLRPSGPFSYADHSTPVFVCSKPLDLEETEKKFTHLKKRVHPKVSCNLEHCNKKFRDTDELYDHLLQHPQFASKPEEEQIDLIDQLEFQDE